MAVVASSVQMKVPMNWQTRTSSARVPIPDGAAASAPSMFMGFAFAAVPEGEGAQYSSTTSPDTGVAANSNGASTEYHSARLAPRSTLALSRPAVSATDAREISTSVGVPASRFVVAEAGAKVALFLKDSCVPTVRVTSPAAIYPSLASYTRNALIGPDTPRPCATVRV